VIDGISLVTCPIPHRIGVLQKLSHQFGVVALGKHGKYVVEEDHQVLTFLAGLEYFPQPILNIILVMLDVFNEKFFHNNNRHLEFLSMAVELLAGGQSCFYQGS
jgi:hypothetical protein